jgi:UDP-glucose 4-epimerase
VSDRRFRVIHADASDVDALTATMEAHDWVIHLASNADIAAAAERPEVDFYRGTLLTNNVVEAMRRAGLRRLLYASGSGVYGDAGEKPIPEDFAPMVPISTYGASKLASESLIASYCAMFGLRACAFRFGNVVGPRQTHGVGFDFLRSLNAKPKRLRILGDGRQSKPYIHVTDVVEAALCAAAKATAPFSVFNVATDDAVTVTEIADLAVEAVGLEDKPAFDYTGGARGWRGDVPVVRLDSTRMRSLGWFPKRNSRDAMRQSLQELMADERILRN